MRITVVGCGYVGLVSAVGLTSLGHRVTGVEIDRDRRAQIAAGRPPFHEPGLEDLLERALAAGRLRMTGEVADAVAHADVVFLAVQTPPRPDGSNDPRFLLEAADAVAGALARAPRRRRVVVVRSTVVPGTTRDLVAPRFAALGGTVAVGASPEFLREGSAVADHLAPDRIVVGVDETWAATRMRTLYEAVDAPLLVTSPATAEMIKYTSNALLATLISFSNEIGRLCEATPTTDVAEVLEAIHLDRRLVATDDGTGGPVGITGYLRAGCGYGGSCLPKDLGAIIAYGRGHGERPRLLEAVRNLNDTQPARLVARAERALGGLRDRHVAVLGLAFKGGTDDVRESPGLRLVEILQSRDAAVTVYDPLVDAATVPALDPRTVTVAASLDDAVAAADACLVTTTAEAFADLGSLPAVRAPDGPLIVDGRRTLDPADVPAGRYAAVGRPLPERPRRAAGPATGEPHHAAPPRPTGPSPAVTPRPHAEELR